MFNKSSTLNSKINNRLNSIKLQQLLSDPKFTKLTILSLSSCLVIYLILPCKTQLLINTLLKHPLIVSSLIVLCLIISLINMSVGISLLLFLGAIYFGQSGYLAKFCKTQNINAIEGFKSNSYKEDIKEKDDELTSKISNLFGDGPFSKSIDEYKKARKELIEEDMAEDNMAKYEAKISNSRIKGNKGKNMKHKEKFSNTSKKVEKFQSIAMRKFNPANKDDTNLLLVMEHCKDIQTRIEYEYEDITYLKKYIKDKLEKIIDLLDLVEDE